MANSSYLTPAKSTHMHAGVNVRKKTTRVNVVIVLAVLMFFVLGTILIRKISSHAPEAPASTTLLTR